MSRDDFMLVEDAATELTSGIFAEIGRRSIERREGQSTIHDAVWELVHESLTALVEKVSPGSEPGGQGKEPHG